MPAGEHDEAVALVSHLPQVAASLVAARLHSAPDAALALTGQGLRDVTRIAASDPGLWVQILGANAAQVAAVLAPLRDDLDALLAALRRVAGADGGPGTGGPSTGAPTGAVTSAAGTGAHAAIARALAAGTEGRARIPGKHGASTEFASVTVLVDDRPGELARLLADMGAAGINLEELRLDHSPGRAVGLAEVSVLPAARAALVERLRALGWAVHEG
jgi:prephenate dehydrogenase